MDPDPVGSGTFSGSGYELLVFDPDPAISEKHLYKIVDSELVLLLDSNIEKRRANIVRFFFLSEFKVCFCISFKYSYFFDLVPQGSGTFVWIRIRISENSVLKS